MLWFWAAVGVVVVGSAVGAAAATVTVHADPYGGSTGTVLSAFAFDGCSRRGREARCRVLP